MCWCDPSKRTPFCNKPGCIPPKSPPDTYVHPLDREPKPLTINEVPGLYNHPMSHTPTGWICPRCNRVHAPHIAGCACVGPTFPYVTSSTGG